MTPDFITAKRFPAALCLVTLLAWGIPPAAAQQSYTWDQIKARFEADNPTLKADQANVDEMKAEEITAYLRPNPQFRLTRRTGRRSLPTTACGSPGAAPSSCLSISYLHERDHKRELRLESAQEGTQHRRLAAPGSGSQHALRSAHRRLSRRCRPRRCWIWPRPISTTTTRSSTSAGIAFGPAIWRRSIWIASS